MGCLTVASMQRSNPDRGMNKTSNAASQDSNHRAGRDQAGEDTEEQPSRRDRIKFPPASQTTTWKELDDELDKVLEEKVLGSVEQRIVIFGETVYDFCKSKFGMVKK